VIENNYAGVGGLYEVTMPMLPSVVADEERRRMIRVFPNPSSTRVKIEIPKGSSYDNYELYDVAMKRMRSGTCQRGNFEISVDDLPAGLYFLRLKGTQGTISEKIVVQ
jgi:hypothetical protein